MIDSHVHLNHKDFKADFDAVLTRAQEAGVHHMVNIGFDLPSSQETVSLVESYDFMYGAVGVHPHDAKTYNDKVEKNLAELLEKPRIVAAGEIGLDFYRDLTPRDEQRAVFKRQLELAESRKKPIIIHCRDAFDDTIRILSGHADKHRGIFHAFSGDSAMARDVLDLGFHIGIGGVVTFRNSNLSEVVTDLPAEAVVLETDCPYLAPMPFRGKRNEPAYLTHVVEKIAATTGQSSGDVIETTSRNFARAMGLN
jgi:TatD DNase family protein